MSKRPLTVSDETLAQIKETLRTNNEATVYFPREGIERTFVWATDVLIERDTNRTVLPSGESFARSFVNDLFGSDFDTTQPLTEEQAAMIEAAFADKEALVAGMCNHAFGSVSSGDAPCSASVRQEQVRKIAARMNAAPPSSTEFFLPPAAPVLEGTVLPGKSPPRDRERTR